MYFLRGVGLTHAWNIPDKQTAKTSASGGHDVGDQLIKFIWLATLDCFFHSNFHV